MNRYRRRRRTTRTLIAALGVAVFAGGASYMLKHTASATAEASTHPVTQPAEAAPGFTPPAQVAPGVYIGSAASSAPADANSTTTTTTTTTAAAPSRVAPSTQPIITLSPSTAAPVVEGKAKLDAGELLAGRKILNDALVSGQLSPDDQAIAKALIGHANQTIIFSARRFVDDTFSTVETVQPGAKLARIAMDHSVTWEFVASLNGLTDPKRLRAGQTIKVIHGPFNAVVTKSTYLMDIWLGEPEKAGSLYVISLPVGLGRDDSTPTGVWRVEASKKIKNPTYFSPRGEGVIAADDPQNPLGEYWIGLTGIDGHAVGKLSYGIHGTIEPDSIGKMSSLGCIRLKNEDVAVVYNLLVDGKSVVVVRE